jgi:predicted transcriptional regulator
MPIPAGKRRVTFDLDVDLYNRLAEIAKAQERDITSQIRFALKQWLETQAPERKPKAKPQS